MQANISGVWVTYPDDVQPDQLIDEVMRIQASNREYGKIVDEIKFYQSGALDIKTHEATK